LKLVTFSYIVLVIAIGGMPTPQSYSFTGYLRFVISSKRWIDEPIFQ